MKNFEKGTLKRIIIKNLLISHKKLLFEIVDYLSDFDIPEINKHHMYGREYMYEEMENIANRYGCFYLIDRIDLNNFSTRDNFFNYDKTGKIYSVSDGKYFLNLFPCIDIIVDEVVKDPELLKL